MSDHTRNNRESRRPTVGFAPHARLTTEELATLRVSLRAGAPVHCPRCLNRLAVDGPRGRGASRVWLLGCPKCTTVESVHVVPMRKRGLLG